MCILVTDLEISYERDAVVTDLEISYERDAAKHIFQQLEHNSIDAHKFNLGQEDEFLCQICFPSNNLCGVEGAK